MRLCFALVLLAGCGSAGSASDDGGGGGLDGSTDVAPTSPDLTMPTSDLSPDLAVTNTATIHFIGRFDFSDPQKPRFAYPGSTITTRFSGTGLTVALEDGDHANRFDVTVDGVLGPELVTSNGKTTYAVASGLPDGEHDVVIARRTESFVGTTTFAGFSGAPLVATAGPTRLIEIIGDSISCGYGILCDDPTQGFSPETEAETLAYGALTAKALLAAHVTVAYSGKGITQNYGGGKTDLMPEVWERTFADDSSSVWGFSYVPDVVVIHLGTNDFWNGDPGADFVTRYTAFVKKVRSHYPAAPIVIALSPMLEEPNRTTCRGYLQTIVADSNDAKVSFVEFAQQKTSDGLGCDYHPNLVTNQKMAVVLEAKLRAVTGW